jgi:beta-N-acetylhexosaminidase
VRRARARSAAVAVLTGLLLTGLLLTGLLLTGRLMPAGSALAGPAQAAGPTDPATWSNRRLAAQLVFTCVDAAHWRTARSYARLGVGGITLMGNDASRIHLRAQLAAVTAAAPYGVRPYIAGDEEGGAVQRLRHVIYPLPSARTMGTWSRARIERTAYVYGTRMKALGVDMDFGPVADLDVQGYYMAQLRRAFSGDPARVTTATAAWMAGMRRAGVVPVVKHWPGHGQARNSHTGVARIPALDVLERRDLLPFRAAFRAGAPIVMVGHLQSAGLTEPGVPASESPRALRYLRAQVGPQTVIITDSLSMDAAARSLHISPARAAVRALRAGADWALVCDTRPAGVITTVRRALSSGALPRAAALAKVRRILALKAGSGLLRTTDTAQPAPASGPAAAATPGSTAGTPAGAVQAAGPVAAGPSLAEPGRNGGHGPRICVQCAAMALIGRYEILLFSFLVGVVLVVDLRRRGAHLGAQLGTLLVSTVFLPCGLLAWALLRFVVLRRPAVRRA